MQELPVLVRDAETDGCRCDGGQPKNFARPCLLLLLAEAPAHGYELIERLRPFGFDLSDPATVYKTLRLLETEGHVTSEWELSARGPARRVYSITPDGHEILRAWAMTLDKQREIVEVFLARVSHLAGGPTSAQPNGRHPRPSTGRRGGEG
ncbi:MAG: helix-turn-helix transcriptional regulator [Chloroflexota bacterium]